jgi:hypothetical protein
MTLLNVSYREISVKLDEHLNGTHILGRAKHPSNTLKNKRKLASLLRDCDHMVLPLASALVALCNRWDLLGSLLIHKHLGDENGRRVCCAGAV